MGISPESFPVNSFTPICFPKSEANDLTLVSRKGSISSTKRNLSHNRRYFFNMLVGRGHVVPNLRIPTFSFRPRILIASSTYIRAHPETIIINSGLVGP